jgi:hypothetical protein
MFTLMLIEDAKGQGKGVMADKTGAGIIFSTALLVIKGDNWTLDANAFSATSPDDAKANMEVWAREKYPDADSYHAQACAISDTDFVDEFVRVINERTEWGKGLAELSKEVEEIKRESGLETKAESIFSSPETDKLQ